MRKAREKKVADDKKAEMEPKLKEKRTGKGIEYLK
jgi:hypothetical protein